MKKVSGSLKLLYSQYRELQAFSQFGSDLDADTKARLANGERIVEVLDEIRRTLEDPQLLEAVQLLEADFETLRALPLTVDVQVDLGLVGSLDYYTGILLKGYLPGSGAEVLSGGRYDRLLAAFGSDLPAIGFALDLDGLICPREDDRRGVPEVLVYADPARPMAAILCGQRLSERGMHWTHSLEDSWEAAVEEARRRGIPRVIEADGSRTAETGGQSR